jgi:hypothetical protein
MRKSTFNEEAPIMAVDIKGLQTMLSVGRDTATKIGAAAGANFRFGKRNLYKVDKINAYIETLTEKAE